MADKIWHQSIADLSALPGYAAALAERAATLVSPGTQVDVHGVRAGTYPPGVDPVEALRYPWVRDLINLQIVENAVRAERQGYAAVALACFYDPGLDEAKSAVDIPVVGICEATLSVASTLGSAFAFLALEPGNAIVLQRLVRKYGFDDRTDVVVLDPPVRDLGELDRALTSPDFATNFARSCAGVTVTQADVVVAAEMVLNEVLVAGSVREVHGLPIVDAFGIVLAYTEMLLRLRGNGSLASARSVRDPRPPDDVVDHLRRITADALKDAEQ